MLRAEWGDVTALETACSPKVCGGKECGPVSSQPGSRPETWLKRAAWMESPWWSLSGGQAAAGRERAQEIIGDRPRKDPWVTLKVGFSVCPGQRRAMSSSHVRPSLPLQSVTPAEPCSQWMKRSGPGEAVGNDADHRPPQPLDHREERL